MLFDILLDNSVAGVVRSVKLSFRMFTLAMIKPGACLNRQAHVTDCSVTTPRGSRAAFAPSGCCSPLPGRETVPWHPGEHTVLTQDPHRLPRRNGEKKLVCYMFICLSLLLALLHLHTAPSFYILPCHLLGTLLLLLFSKLPSSSHSLTSS